MNRASRSIGLAAFALTMAAACGDHRPEVAGDLPGPPTAVGSQGADAGSLGAAGPEIDASRAPAPDSGDDAGFVPPPGCTCTAHLTVQFSATFPCGTEICDEGLKEAFTCSLNGALSSRRVAHC